MKKTNSKIKFLASISLVIKGAIIGVANIIPGVSGGTLAITLGLYERIISTITHFFSNFKENVKFLLPIGIGAIIAILGLSKLLTFALGNYKIETVMFFIGLILGGVPILLSKVKIKNAKPINIFWFILTFSIVVLFAILSPGNTNVSLEVLNFKQILLLAIVGIIAAATMVIPGISGSFVLMLLGYYEPIVKTISNLTNFNNISHNLLILIPFGIGIVLGIFIIAKIIEWLLKKYEISTYYGIIGFVLSSIISIFIPLSGFTFTNVSVGLVLMIIGFYGAYKLSKMR